jgi:hypothetical protein
MRITTRKATAVVSALLCLVATPLVAQSDEGKTTLATILQSEEPLLLTHWMVSGKDGNLLCIISQRPAADRQIALPTRTLTIYREGSRELVKIYRLETDDWVLNLYPLGDNNSRLFFTGGGGSAYHFRVFSYAGGKVKQVFEQGSKVQPEILYDDEGLESILITEPVLEKGKWTSVHGTTEVFKWDGKEYDKIGVVPWEKRLQCITRESCRSLR